jgi:uncharacterized protein (TIGR02118 family)
MVHLLVLYPQPANVEQFEKDYVKHLELLHDKTGISTTEIPYTVTKFLPLPAGTPAFHQMFTLPFDTQEALEAAISSPGMQEGVADANRISTGGAPTILIGNVG